MPRPSRKRVVVHFLALLCMVAGMLLQPALASLGALHEIAEMTGRAPAPVHAEAPATAGLTAEQGRAPADPLHVLLHYAHCCGPSGALFARMPTVAQPHAAVDAPPMRAATAVRRTYLRGPFRPPIPI